MDEELEQLNDYVREALADMAEEYRTMGYLDTREYADAIRRRIHAIHPFLCMNLVVGHEGEAVQIHIAPAHFFN